MSGIRSPSVGRWCGVVVVCLALTAALLPGRAAAQAVNFFTTNYPAGSLPRAVAVGDFNGDSKSDLAVATNTVSDPADHVVILLGDGQGGFGAPTAFPVGDSPESVAVGHFNGDANVDLAVANTGSDNVAILLGTGSGGFTAATHIAMGDSARVVAVGDFNEDSRQDLAVGLPDAAGLRVIFGNGNGGFGSPISLTEGVGQSIAVGHLNNDSHLDLVADTGPYHVSVWLGDGTGGFSGPNTFVAGVGPTAVAIGEFNHDVHPDIAVANSGAGPSVSVLYGDGSGGYPTRLDFEAGPVPYGVSVGDFNMDGWDDVATANTGSDTVAILLGTGFNWRFHEPTRFSTGDVPISVALGNFNADSRPDLVTANGGSANVSILLNVAGNAGYPRPKAASPIDVSLVTAFDKCVVRSGWPNRTHGPPLEHRSCSPPFRDSSLTVGTPDANGLPVTAVGKARYDVISGVPGGADDSDVSFALSVNDVRDPPSGGGAYPDYTGELEATTVVRITDRAPAEPRGTVIDIFASVTVPCTPTGGPADVGANCAISTSFDAITPGMVPEGRRAVWELGKVEVYDGGPDDDADTCCQEDLFLVQGVFVP